MKRQSHVLSELYIYILYNVCYVCIYTTTGCFLLHGLGERFPWATYPPFAALFCGSPRPRALLP